MTLEFEHFVIVLQIWHGEFSSLVSTKLAGRNEKIHGNGDCYVRARGIGLKFRRFEFIDMEYPRLGHADESPSYLRCIALQFNAKGVMSSSPGLERLRSYPGLRLRRSCVGIFGDLPINSRSGATPGRNPFRVVVN